MRVDMHLVKNLLLLVVISAGPCRPHRQDDTAGPRKVARNAYPQLIVNTLLEPPFMMLKVDGAFLMGNDRFEGYLADMLARLARGVGFDYQIRLATDGRVGEINEHGNWTGMLGEVHRGEADIAAGHLTITDEREEVVDFTIPFMTFRSSALIRKPKRGKRIRIKTAHDLLRSHIPYGVIQNSIAQKQFMASWNATYRQMWGKMATAWPSTFVQSTQEGVARASRERYAFILDSPAAEYIAGRKPCNLYTIEPFLDLKHYAFAVKKGNRLKDALNVELRVMQANQELQLTYLKWWTSECTRRVKPTLGPRDVRTIDTYGRRETTTELNPWRYATASGYSHSTQLTYTATFSLLALTAAFLAPLN